MTALDARIALDTGVGSRAVNPATGEVLADHLFETPNSVSARLDGARSAFETWRAVPIARRIAVLTRIGAQLRERCDGLAKTMTREMGKPISQSRGEVQKCAALCDWYAANGPAQIADEPTSVEGDAASVCFLPLGVVLGVMPWNYPLWQAIRAIVPILLAGNGFVLKPAPNCVATAMNLRDVVEHAGAPEGLVSVLHIAEADVGAVIEDPRIAAVTLTGSVRAGSAVAAAAGRAIKKTLLELGGSDPFIVLADANLDKAAAAAVLSRFQNCGQTCIAAKRIIVEAPVAEAFIRLFVARVQDLKLGDPMNPDTFIGPMARINLRDELADQVGRSVRQGARVLLEGGPAGATAAAYFKPMVLGGVRPGMAAFDEETFGPVAAIVVAEDDADAVRLANLSEFGLSGAIWTAGVDRARALARQLETGGVFINGYAASDPRTPIGGVKKSGYGRELSHFGVREFTNAQVVWVNRQ